MKRFWACIIILALLFTCSCGKKEFSWLEMSGDYVDDQGLELSLYITTDELTGKYIAAVDLMPFEDVVIEGNSLMGVNQDVAVCFIYDEDSKKVAYSYFDSSIGYEENAILKLDKACSQKEAKAAIKEAYEVLAMYEKNEVHGESYDTSKASGILASLGMTEKEFRNNCQRLFSNKVQIGTPNGTELYYSDLIENPTNYLNSYFAIDNLSGYDFECSFKGVSDDGYTYYEDYDYYNYNAVIFDYRDDVYAPNIIKGDNFTPYVIFKDVRTSSNGDEWLVFWMICADK